jgi:pyridoxal phosphate enzyme (YggS family)
MACRLDPERSTSLVAENLQSVRGRIARAAQLAGRPTHSVRLVLATKTVLPERIREAIAAGHSDFAENKVQEGRTKAMALAGLSVRWSMIGHLQTNKVKDVLRFADEVQSLDRISLAETLDRHLQHLGRSLDVLVQVNTSDEPTKYGLPAEGTIPFLREMTAFSSLNVRGFMTLARFTPDIEEVRRCFKRLRSVRDQAREAAPQGVELHELSMGMSGDFEVAIAEGATIVRVGQAVFGRRELPDEHYWPRASAPRATRSGTSRSS